MEKQQRCGATHQDVWHGTLPVRARPNLSACASHSHNGPGPWLKTRAGRT